MVMQANVNGVVDFSCREYSMMSAVGRTMSETLYRVGCLVRIANQLTIGQAAASFDVPGSGTAACSFPSYPIWYAHLRYRSKR